MAINEIEATLEDGKVIITNQEDATALLEGGYGSINEERDIFVFSPCEALYLLTQNRLKIVNKETGENLNFQSLLSILRPVELELWTKYLIYRDLRSRGYVVREGFGLGVDFRLYSRGTYGEKAAKFLVYAICEGTPTPIKKLQKILFTAQNMKKQLIVAVMDRRGEIVYYSLTQLSLF